MAYKDGEPPPESRDFDTWEAEDQLREDRRKESKYEEAIENAYKGFSTVDAGDVCRWKTLSTFQGNGGLKLISITSQEDCYAPREAIDWMREVEGGGCPVNVAVWRMSKTAVDECIEGMTWVSDPSPEDVVEYAIGNMDTSEFLDKEYRFHSLRNAIQWAKENL